MIQEQQSPEVATLRLGGENAAVQVRETSERPQEQTASQEVNNMAVAMFHDYEKGQLWLKETFFDKSGPDILQAVRLFCQKVNYARTESNQRALNILELDDVVARQAKGLASSLQILCTWTVLVRIGVRKLQRDMLGLVAMVPMPPVGGIRLAQPADNVGKTHYVVTHLLGEKFLCRGYAMHVTREGDWVLGGSEGNRWHKDLWLTPGIQSVEAILAAKRRKIAPSWGKSDNAESGTVKRILDDTRTRVEKARDVAGIKASHFGAAHGARLDLENKPIMQAALACVRAMIAQVLSAKEEQALDEIAARHGMSKSAISKEIALAGAEASAFEYHMARRDHANSVHRACGRFVIPQGFMVFASQSIPATIPEEIRAEVAGVVGVAVSAEHLTGLDYAQLKHSPAALSDVEDLSPLIDACGVAVINGDTVTDMEAMQDEAGTEYTRYYVDGREPVDMPRAEFDKRAFVKFVPMVLRCKRKHMVPEDMQGSQNGIYFAMSFDDVAERFVPCRHNNSTKSNRSYS